MGKEEQLQWERKWAPPAAGAAFVAALLPIASTIWASSLLGSLPTKNSEALFLQRVNDHAGGYVAAGVLTALGTAALAPVLVYLYNAVRARRPQIPRIALILAVAAPLVAGGAGIARQAVLASTASDYVKHPPAARPASELVAEQKKLNALKGDAYSDEKGKFENEPAKDKLKSGSITTVAYVGLIANLLLGTAFVLISMNAMRAGLLSRFMGILGVIVGALTAIPILGGAPVVQLFWLVAMGVLFLNRWPQGRGPAWEAVEPIPWPTAQERRDAIAPAGSSARDGAGSDDDDDDDDEPEELPQHTREAARPRPSAQHPRSKKRKRKRRG